MGMGELDNSAVVGVLEVMAGQNLLDGVGWNGTPGSEQDGSESAQHAHASSGDECADSEGIGRFFWITPCS